MGRMRSFAEQVTGSWPPESQVKQLFTKLCVVKSALWHSDDWNQGESITVRNPMQSFTFCLEAAVKSKINVESAGSWEGCK